MFLWMHRLSDCVCALLIRAQMSPRDLHTFQHELGYLAEENTNIHKGEHAQQKDWIGNTENKKKDKDAWHILHRTGFLTRLQWLHPPLAASNNYRCGLNLDPVVFSSQWNMGPSLKWKKKKRNVLILIFTFIFLQNCLTKALESCTNWSTVLGRLFV